jgi:hypothetical protein
MSAVELERVRFLEHKGRRILFMDLSNIKDPNDGFPLADRNQALVCAEPPGSVLTLTYVANGRFNSAIIKRLTELAKSNKAYVKAGAIVGLSGLQRVVYVTLSQLSGRRLPTFDTVNEAKDWLAAQ